MNSYPFPSSTRSQEYSLVVGIGASAGGLEAFQKLIEAIPPNSGIAYILVQHLFPKHESMLPEILQKISKIPVVEIKDEVKIRPDCIFVMPSNKILTAEDGILILEPRPENSHKNTTIDIFFSSLATVHQSKAVGVLLSGKGTDGTKGLKVIQECGGITIVQNINSASFGDMPQNALDEDLVDYVLLPEEISQKLIDILNNKPAIPETIKFENKDTEEYAFNEIYYILFKYKDVDFTHYKQTTVQRRIKRRMAIMKIENIVDYLEHLKKHVSEQDALFQDMLIPVTEFFRDAETFKILKSTILPDLLKVKSELQPLRIWIAGCSTGQEVYSIAMTLFEYLNENDHFKIQIFATDISEKAIAKARDGIYSEKEIKGVSQERINRFFNKTNEHYQIKKHIRNICVFAYHNFLKDPPFAKMDIISCRNVLIYMNLFLQQKAFTTFNYALNKDGYLILGKSENILNSSELFFEFDKKSKIYLKKITSSNYKPILNTSENSPLKLKHLFSKKEQKTDNFQKNADDILLASHTPPGLIINSHLDIVQFRGKINPFLQPSPGKASLNILKMVLESLTFELRNAILKSKDSGEPYMKEGIPIENGKKLVNIEVIPLLNTIEAYFLILFKEASSSVEENDSLSLNEKKDRRIANLEKELAILRQDMHIITEVQEDINEELQSANEELLSDSEELQSLNEELETSTEELRSTNEELLTSNQELFNRNDQLNKAREYSDKIISMLHEPLIILNKKLEIKKVNQAFYKTFKLQEKNCLGKNLFKIEENQWDISELREAFDTIQNEKENFIEKEITHHFPLIGERTILFNVQQIEQKSDQPVFLLALQDITERNLINKADAVLNERKTFHDFFQQAPAAFCILKGPDLTYEFANPSYIKLIGNRNPIGKPLKDALPELQGQGYNEILKKVYTSGNTYNAHEISAYLKQENGNLEKVFLDLTFKAFKNIKGEIEGILACAYNITELVNNREEIQQNERQYKSLLFGLPIAVYTCDQNGYIQLFNDAAAELWGQKPTIGKDKWCGSWKLFNMKGVPINLEDCPMAIALNTGRIVQSEMILQKPNGDKRFVKVFPQLSVGKNGDINGAINTMIDITDQINARKDIQQNFEMLNDLYMNASAFMCNLKGKDLNYGVVNPQYQKIFGNKVLLEKNFFDVHPELKEQGLEEIFEQVYNTGKPFIGTEFSLLISKDEGKSPEPVYFNFSCQPMFDRSKEINGILILGYDITSQVMARKESEEGLKKILESMPIMTWTNLSNGNINFYNQKWYDYTGLDYEETKSWSWRKVVHPDDLNKTVKAYFHSLRTCEIFEVENRYKKHDGTYRWFLNRALPILNRENEVEIWVGSATDINEQKITEQKKDEFIGIASHEMKTPITTAKAYLQLLEHSLENQEEAGMFAKKASSSIERLNNLISELLDISKIQNGKLIHNIEEFDFNEFLSDTIGDLQRIFSQHKIIKSGKTTRKINGDKERLKQVLINLLSNAVKYSPNSDKVFVSITETNDQLEVAVKDEGIGLTKANSEKVFDRYFRVEESAVQFHGLGLGLYISSEIIQRHQGKIWINSRIGKGSTFYFSLPFDSQF